MGINITDKEMLLLFYIQTSFPLRKEVNTISEDEDFDDLEIEDEEKQSPDRQSINSKVPESKIPVGVRVNLFFRSTIGPGEKLEKLTIDTNMPVKELVTTLGEIFGLDPQDFHLSIAGRTLDPDDILSNYDLEDGMECLIIPVSTAGFNRIKWN